MKGSLLQVVNQLGKKQFKQLEIIDWGSPIISFGDLTNARVATLGINPSNKEFLDNYGNELEGPKRRFPTLRSLGISNWSELDELHCEIIIEHCSNYFSRNPYDAWFKRLDYIISGSGSSYYFPSYNACHLDLIPFATFSKWTNLSNCQKNDLLNISVNFLGNLLNDSSIEVIVLNGQTVVDNLEKISHIQLVKKAQLQWTLPRRESSGVLGFSYEGYIDRISNIKLKKPVRVLGYNHNIQSSFGVTNSVQESIRCWISKGIKMALQIPVT